MKIGNHEFDLDKKIHVMGILNCTPDSFFDGGKYNQIDSALIQADKMISEGAAVIDIGGESTRPGYTMISDKEEIERVIPLISILKKRFDIPLSIDSYKPNVVKAALDTGADMVNDIWGLRKNEKMAELVVEYDVPICIMHNREEAIYKNFLSDVISDLRESLAIAEKIGIDKGKIILDPGIGFAKSYEQNLQIINCLEMVVGLGYPVLLATSGKSVIGRALDLPVEEREEGTLATSVIGAIKGCNFVRVHNVEANVRALQMVSVIQNSMTLQ